MKKELQKEKIITGVLAAFAILTVISGISYMGGDFGKVLLWWGVLLGLGVINMPLTYMMFSRFRDFGWAFSKSIGLALSAWLMWMLSSTKIMKFSQPGCIFVCVLVLVLNGLLYFFCYGKKQKKIRFTHENINSILWVEIIFLAMFIFWSYLRGCKPEAYGTEKFMDFGFMKIMERSEYMPPQDLWLSGQSLNYYYVGQFVGSFLSKLSGIGVEYGYNLMLMTIAALSCALIFSLVRNCFAQLTFEKIKNVRLFAVIAGIISVLATVFAGNGHYIIYGMLRPWLQKFIGVEVASFYFPNSTRFIGYEPDVPDKTIHEFPSYSFILGDLHAHVINIIFVLSVLGILFAWLLYRRDLIKSNKKYSMVQEVLTPHILMLGFLIGFFHTTNFWDYPIYYVVCGAVILFSNIELCNFDKYSIVMTAIHGVLIFAIAAICCLPFTLAFNQISTEIKLCENHTPFYQLAVLWGIPIFIVVLYIVNMIYRNIREGAYQDAGHINPVACFFGAMKSADLFMFVLGLCAIGLTFMPEVIYVKDIYEGAYSRANTMFKLTYQAYIMYGIVIGYAVMKMFVQGKGMIRRCCVWISILVLLTLGYFGNASRAWFGEYANKDTYKSLDATDFMETECYADYEATNWLNDNIEGTPVVLEANGDSYTFYERVSTITGLPTVLGWKTHEKLWRCEANGDLPEIVSEREEDVRNIYTATDVNVVKEIIEKYDISYIYIGKCEYEKFPEMNIDFLKSLGEVVYEITTDLTISDQMMEKTTYIIEINR